MKDSSDSVIALVLILVIFAVAMVASYFAKSYACRTGWEQSGYASKFGFITGCLVQKDGKWFPSSSIREID